MPDIVIEVTYTHTLQSLDSCVLRDALCFSYQRRFGQLHAQLIGFSSQPSDLGAVCIIAQAGALRTALVV